MAVAALLPAAGLAFAAVLATAFGAGLTAAFGANLGAVLAAALEIAFVARLAGGFFNGLRAEASDVVFALAALDGFDFAATFFDFATALAMRCFDPQLGRRNRATYTTLGRAAQAKRFRN